MSDGVNVTRLHCNNCRTSYSNVTGGPFHKTHLPPETLLKLAEQYQDGQPKVSLRQVSRDLRISKSTGLRMDPIMRSLPQPVEYVKKLFGL
jgi:transposase-like protein